MSKPHNQNGSLIVILGLVISIALNNPFPLLIAIIIY